MIERPMFRKNTEHLQGSLLGSVDALMSESQKKAFLESPERWFYEILFKRIDEKIFAPLYAEGKSRPNAPINCMVGALILQSHNRWSYEFLMRQVRFDLLTRAALGLTTLDEVPFCEATLFNFQNRMLSYQIETGTHLLEQVFDSLTAEHLKILKIKTDMQRCDSLQVESNIRSYSRIQLLIEVLLRVWRALSAQDQERYKETFAPFEGKTSGQYVYRIEHVNLGRELDRVAAAYLAVRETVRTAYGETDIGRIFERVFDEHFTVADDRIAVRPSKQLHSGCLQSPDDEDATYRNKRGVGYRGQILTATETCNPENELQLITDVHVTANNRDDSDELHDRLDGIKEKTPEIAVIYTDGGYGSEKNDIKMEMMAIEQVQTAIKGRASEVDITITKHEDGSYEVRCPQQSGVVHKTKKRWKAVMRGSVCAACPMRDTCQSQQRRSGRVVFFDDEDFLRQRRQGNIRSLPLELRNLRPNVEATMREFSRRLENGKLKVRGLFKAQTFALATAMGINYGRVYRYARG
jgi:Transposase DDE domain/Transposase domain (DUF772)